MDNLHSHKSSCVIKEYQHPRINVLYLSPYSPEFSAIENLFC